MNHMPLSREYQLDELECQHANDRYEGGNVVLVLLIAASTALMGLAVVGGFDVFHRAAAWVSQW